jgi:hypothetical protein
MSRRGGHNRTVFTDAQVELLRSQATHKALARAFGMSDMPIRNWRKANGWSKGGGAPKAPLTNPLGTPGRVDTPDETTVTGRPVLQAAVASAGGAEPYLRATWNLAAEDWYCTSATVNQWEGPQAGGGVVIYAQAKGSFRPVKALADLIPSPAVWTGPRYGGWARHDAPFGGSFNAIVMGDHQAPYIDEALHAATLRMIEAVEPEELVHLGDLCDYTTISRHRDHAYVKAEVDACTQSGVDILASIRAAAPDARFRIIPGNHDVRPLTELLARAERMAGIRCAKLPGEESRDELLNLKALWRLDDLGIELCDDPRGWDHAEVELVPGPRGLVVIHGYLTGNNVAGRTLDKVGRSVIMGHTHGPEHVYQWCKPLGIEQQAVVIGCQCAVRGESHHFPTFAANDTWLQGPALVTVHDDGEFAIERARWTGKHLIVGSERF